MAVLLPILAFMVSLPLLGCSCIPSDLVPPSSRRYAIFFSAEILVGAGWVDKMPQTQVGKWFVLFYAV